VGGISEIRQLFSFGVLHPDLLGPESSPVSKIFKIISCNVSLLKEEAHGIAKSFSGKHDLGLLKSTSSEKSAKTFTDKTSHIMAI
jgi:hypothetical protein